MLSHRGAQRRPSIPTHRRRGRPYTSSASPQAPTKAPLCNLMQGALPLRSMTTQRMDNLSTPPRVNLFALAEPSSGSEYDGKPLADATDLTLPAVAAQAVVRVFSSAAERLRSRYCAASDRAVYVWGVTGHPAGDPLAVLERNPDDAQLRELHGQFLIIIDDRHRREVTFISDVLGLRPWFVGAYQGRLVAGSDVPTLCEAGLSRGEIDYDTVACWLQYNFPCNGGSIVRDYLRLEPGAALTYDSSGVLLRREPYAQLSYGFELRQPESLIDTLHALSRESFNLQAAGAGELNIPLSGGYDSRYVAALALDRPGRRVHLTTVSARANEAPPARRVAEALHQPLRVIDVPGHLLDLFDDPLAFDPAGFPAGRNLTCAVARMYPGVPVASGFLGDRLIRGTITPLGIEHFAKDEQGLGVEPLVQAAHQLYVARAHRLYVLEDAAQAGVRERALNCLARLVRQGIDAGKPLCYADLYGRHRFYLANIFQQHLDEAEALLPFYCRELLNLHTRHANASYSGRNHEMLFAQHYPRLCGIPHSSELGSALDPAGRSRHLRRWSAKALGGLLRSGLPGVKTRWLLRRVPVGLLGNPRHQDEILFLWKLFAFSQRLQQCNLHLDLSRL
jgi:hypothetical protein